MILKRNFLAVLIFIFLCILYNPLFAQRTSKAKTKTLTADEAKAVKKDAASMFNAEDYNNALPAYLALIKTKPQDAEYNYRIGYCYLMSNSVKSKAVPYLEFASQAKDAK
jgi:hypothetical protein